MNDAWTVLQRLLCGQATAADDLANALQVNAFGHSTFGRTVGAFADLAGGVISRLWVIAATATTAVAEPAVPVARDDFMSQLRQPCQGDASDNPDLQAGHWPQVVEQGVAALATLRAPPTPSAASSSQVCVMRAFSSGDSVLALYRLRIQGATLPRQSHDRLALAAARVQGGGGGAGLPHRLALSDPLPDPPPVSF